MVPSEQGFYMPAEWYPHEACWMAWPSHENTWETIGLERARDLYVSVAQAIAKFEPVKMLANPAHVDDAQNRCGDKIKVIPLPINDSWTRDTGPTFLLNKNKQLAGVDWLHNAWGGLYEDCALDQMIARAIIDYTDAKYFHANLVLEGGSVTVDGEGSAIVTRECLLNKNRNPDLNIKQIEKYLQEYLGVTKIIWLNKGLYEDETDGHVDEVACFIAPGKVLAITTQDENDINYVNIKENIEILRTTKDAKGRSLEVHTVEQPAAEYIGDRRLTLSYINFYIANQGIVMPEFGQPQYDDAAFTTINQLFPDYEVVQIPGKDIVTGGGGIHCITQQQPVCKR